MFDKPMYLTLYTLLCILLLLKLVHQPATAQTIKRNQLKVNLFGPIAGYYTISYERNVNENKSFQIGLGYLDSPLASTINLFGFENESSITGFYTLLDYRFYLSNEGFPKGFFVSPFLRYQNLTLKDRSDVQGINETSKANFNIVCAGLVVGWQWIFKEVLTVDVWGGPEAYSKSDFALRKSDGREALRYSHSPVLLRLGANIGFAF